MSSTSNQDNDKYKLECIACPSALRHLGDAKAARVPSEKARNKVKMMMRQAKGKSRKTLSITQNPTKIIIGLAFGED